MATFRFIGGTTFNARTGEVRRDDTITRLEPQPALLLSLLIDRAGELVTHDEIRRAVWGDDTHVDFRDGVHYCIRQIRAAFGDQALAPGVITTVPKRGYRLNSEALVPGAGRDGGWRRRLVVTGLVAGLALAMTIVEGQPNNHHDTAVAVLKAVHDFIF